MAASINELVFQQISCQFLEMFPIRRMKWSTPLSEDMLSLDIQKKVLEATVLSPLCQEYPPALSYQRAFVKKFLQRLEEFDVEICDEIYEVYTDLLRQQEEDDDTLCYKTYTLSPGNTVTLQESVNMISCGTTGLSTWQAAQHLAEWALQNKDVFESRNVLELGSGLGHTGLSILKQCHCKSFTFTDCHTQVLYLLARNIQLNLGANIPLRNSSQSKLVAQSDLNTSPSNDANDTENTDLDVEDAPILRQIKRQLSLKSGKTPVEDDTSLSDFCELPSEVMNSAGDESLGDEFGGCAQGCEELELSAVHWAEAGRDLHMLRGRDDVWLARLDWEMPDDRLIEKFGAEADIIIAADVVYDKTVIPSLVAVLKVLLCGAKKRCSCALIASTVRNEDTRDQFLISMSSEGLRYQPVEPPREEIFHYDRSVPIEILRITAADLT